MIQRFNFFGARDSIFNNDIDQVKQCRRDRRVIPNVQSSRVHLVVSDHANYVKRPLNLDRKALLNQLADIRVKIFALLS